MVSLIKRFHCIYVQCDDSGMWLSVSVMECLLQALLMEGTGCGEANEGLVMVMFCLGTEDM